MDYRDYSIENFYKFEKDNHLFDLKDRYGNYIWDIFRFDVYWLSKPGNISSMSYKKRKRNNFRLLVSYIYTILPIKCKYFCFLASRNKKNGKYFDQNMYDFIELIDKKDKFLLETSELSNVIYSQPVGSIGLRNKFYQIFNRFINVDNDVINNIFNRIQCYYPICTLEKSYFEFIYKNFYFDYIFYKILFKIHRTKVVLLTQNGIQKGLFFAAKTLNIPVYEFQHGIVYNGHVAYSYPYDVELNEKVYLPSTVLSLSDFWFNDMYLPAKKKSLGNDYFSKPVIRQNKSFILIISAYNFSSELISVTKEIAQKSELSFVYKLHPNEFCNKDKYIKEFAEFSNVAVYTDEFSVNELLYNTDKLLTVCSTAVYEALQAGIPSIIYKGNIAYVAMDHIKNCEGVYYCESVDQINELLLNKITFTSTNFFDQFDEKKAKEIIIDVEKNFK